MNNFFFFVEYNIWFRLQIEFFFLLKFCSSQVLKRKLRPL